MSTISKIINVALFVIYSGVLLWIGYHFANKTTIITPPSIVVFRGAPDSSKEAITSEPIPNFKQGKLDSVKSDSNYSKIIPQTSTGKITNGSITRQETKYTSYKSYTDTLANYLIKVIGDCKPDSINLTVKHFPMKEVQVPDKWKYFDYGMIIGAVGILIVEYIIYKIFK